MTMIASALVFLHVAAGAVSMASGAAALAVRKGAGAHRMVGSVFFISMLVTAGLGSGLSVAYGERINAVGGVFALYLAASAWATVRRGPGKVGLLEYGAPLFALTIGAAALEFGLQASASPAGELDGQSAGISYMFAILAAFAGALDLTVVLRSGVFGAQRIARHVWRMCTALLFAAGSFFIGQQELFPASLQGSPILIAPVLAVFASMVFWLFRVQFTNAFKAATSPA